MTNNDINELGRQVFEKHCGRPHPWDGLQPWVIALVRAARAMPRQPLTDDQMRACARAALATSAQSAGADARDAARYRWLRDVSVPPHNFYISVPVEFHGVRYTPAEVDAGIDAAIASQGVAK